MFSKVHEFGTKMEEMNNKCRALRIQGKAAGGLVQVEVNGLSEVLNCTIDPTVFSRGDHEFLEDLIITATNGALEEAKIKHAETMRSLAGSLDLPGIEGLGDLFNQFKG